MRITKVWLHCSTLTLTNFVLYIKYTVYTSHHIAIYLSNGHKHVGMGSTILIMQPCMFQLGY